MVAAPKLTATTKMPRIERTTVTLLTVQQSSAADPSSWLEDEHRKARLPRDRVADATREGSEPRFWMLGQYDCITCVFPCRREHRLNDVSLHDVRFNLEVLAGGAFLNPAQRRVGEISALVHHV